MTYRADALCAVQCSNIEHCTVAGAFAASMGTPRPLMRRIWWPGLPKEGCCPMQPPTTSSLPSPSAMSSLRATAMPGEASTGCNHATSPNEAGATCHPRGTTADGARIRESWLNSGLWPGAGQPKEGPLFVVCSMLTRILTGMAELGEACTGSPYATELTHTCCPRVGG